VQAPTPHFSFCCSSVAEAFIFFRRRRCVFTTVTGFSIIQLDKPNPKYVGTLGRPTKADTNYMVVPKRIRLHNLYTHSFLNISICLHQTPKIKVSCEIPRTTTTRRYGKSFLSGRLNQNDLDSLSSQYCLRLSSTS
jgi:hypothetical protein